MNISKLVLAARLTDQCVVPDGGRTIVTYEGLRISLHRLVWMLNGQGPSLRPKDFLLRTCETPGCVSPKHHVISATPWPLRERCPNDHVYTPEDETPTGRRCHVCAEARKLRRRRGGEPNWVEQKRRQFCPSGHAYTPDNIYWETTPAGRRKRHCKTCVRARRAGLDPADVIAA